MSLQVATHTQSRPAGRGRRPFRGRAGARGTPRNTSNARGGLGSQQAQTQDLEITEAVAKPIKTTGGDEASKEADDDEESVCWICAEPVKYYSVSECNHRTCHVCALRLRALYKKLDCTFCKEPQQTVIFTTSPDATFSSYTPERIPYKDPKLSIFFETEEMMEETLILLRFNCPDPKCDYIAVAGWGDLKLHAREVHGKLMCDMCIRHKKIFSHEQVLYSPSQLPSHLPSMLQRGRKPPPKEQIEGGVHPLCAFCRDCYFSDDELYAHMRERHEECFVCKRNEVRDQYFQNYQALEQHFTHAHHPCSHPECLARKFVVFGSALDLKAHMVEEHGADMSARDKKDVRRIQADFEFEDPSGNRRGGRRDRGDNEREREREPPPHQGPSRPGGRRREGFGGHLTEGNFNVPASTPEPSRRPSPSPTPADTDVDPEVAERHAAFSSRLRSVAPNNANVVPAVRAAIRSYRASESAARDLISTIWNILDRDLDSTASIINALVDLLDEEEKKTDLLAAWNGFKLEQRRNFPDLVPTATGNEYAGIAAGRVLNAKHSTATRSSATSSRQVWDRVAQAAAASPSSSSATPPPRQRPPDRFPALNPQGLSSAPAPVPAYRQPQRSTPWASTVAASSPSTRAQSSAAQSGFGRMGTSNARTVAAPPSLSKSAFPELPSSNGGRVKSGPVKGNQSLKNILGKTVHQPASAWAAGNTERGANGGSSADPDVNESQEVLVDGAEPKNETSGGKKKGKGKQKQMLFTLGTFPT